MNESGALRIFRGISQVGFIIAIIVTIWFSLIPIDQIPSASRVPDVVTHFFGYAILGFLSIASGLRWRTGLVVVFTLGVLLEILQGLFGYRYFEIKDIVVNGLGAAAGVGVGFIVVAKLFTTYRYRHR